MTKQNRHRFVFVQINHPEIEWDIDSLIYDSGDLAFNSDDSVREWFLDRANRCEEAAALIHVVKPYTQDGKTVAEIPQIVMANPNDFMSFWVVIKA